MDRVLAIMPNDLGQYLAALSAVQAMVKEMKNVELEVVRNHYVYLDAALPACKFVGDYLVRGMYDMVCEFDVHAAYKLSIATERHIAQVFGILIGSDPAAIPDLSKVEIDKEPGGILRLDANTSLAQIAGAEIVVGERSGYTYLAAALGKPVVEIYPRDRHKGWLSKWPRYAQLYGNVDEISEQQITEATEALTTCHVVEAWQ